jgi:hypothetical protein
MQVTITDLAPGGLFQVPSAVNTCTSEPIVEDAGKLEGLTFLCVPDDTSYVTKKSAASSGDVSSGSPAMLRLTVDVPPVSVIETPSPADMGLLISAVT